MNDGPVSHLCVIFKTLDKAAPPPQAISKACSACVSPLIVFLSLLYLSADVAALHPGFMSHIFSKKTVKRRSVYTLHITCSATVCIGVDEQVFVALLYIFPPLLRVENLRTKAPCNAASSLMRPAGIGAPHCQCAVKALSDGGVVGGREGGWLFQIHKQNHTLCHPYL